MNRVEITRTGGDNNEDKGASSSGPYPIFRPPFTDYNHAAFTHDPDIASLHYLGDDCLLVVLGYLHFVAVTKLMSVCRKFYNLCTFELGRRKRLSVDSEFYPYKLAENIPYFVSVLARTNRNLDRLDLSLLRGSGCMFSEENVRKGIFRTISDLCPQLEQLDMPAGIKFSEEIAIEYSRFIAPNIKTLDGFHSFQKNYEKNLGIIFSNCKNLQYLELNYLSNHIFTGECIKDHLNDNRMKSIDLFTCFNIKPSVVQFIFESYHESLEQLRLEAYTKDMLSFPKDKIQTFRSLRCFDFGTIGKGKLPDSDDRVSYTRHFVDLLRFMPNLTTLNCSDNEIIDWSYQYVGIIPVCCPVLIQLVLSRCLIRSFEHLRFIAEYSDTLKVLDIACVVGPRAGLGHFVTNTLVKLIQVEELRINKCEISEAHIFTIINNLLHLSKLDMMWSTLSAISDEKFTEELCALKQHTRYKTLKIWTSGIRERCGEDICHPIAVRAHLKQMGDAVKDIVVFL